MNDVLNYLTSAHAFVSLAVILGAVALLRVSRSLRARMLHKDDERALPAKNERVIRVSFDVAKYVILLVSLLLILQVNGINVGSLIASLGLLSAVVGLALQDALKDVIMGLHILTDHFFTVGDVVRYGDVEGEIVSFGVKTTKIRDINDGRVVSVCNRAISEITVVSDINDLDLPLSYDEDPEKVRLALTRVAETVAALPDVSACVYEGPAEFADSAVRYRLRYRCPPVRKYDTRLAAMRLAQKGLREANIQIPYNQLDVHVR